MNSEPPFSSADIQAQLERILASATFATAPQVSNFVRFVVQETLAGRAVRIKQYTVAVEAFGRDPGFNPTTDPIVRIQAGRVRRFLARYYREQGAEDPIRIEIPLGTYVPLFRSNHRVTDAAPQPSAPLPRFEEDPALALPSGPSLLLLPLEMLASDEEQAHLADGLLEQLAVALKAYPDFRIVGPLSRERLKAPDALPLQALGQCYGTRFVLQGRLRQGGDQIRINFQVIDLSTRGTLWAKTYDGRLSATDLFAFEDTVTKEVAATLADDFGVIHRSLAPQALDKATDNLQVFDAMLRYHHYFEVLTDEMWTAAHVALERAVEADPSYAPTHVMLADLQGTQYHLAGAGEETLQRMEELVARALKLEPQNERAHQMKAMTHLFRGRRDLFIAEAEWVTRHNPNNSNALASMGLFLAIVGEWERGLALTEKAMRLNPHYPGWNHLGPFLNLYRRGAYQEALREAMRINTAGFYLDPLARAATLGQLGRAAEAASALEEMQRLLPDNGIELREFMRRTLFSDENVDMLLEGLQKAGLELVE